MKATFSSSIILAIFAVGTLGNPVKREDNSADDRFLSTCANIVMDPTTAVVSAVCKSKSGDPVNSALSLDLCVGNGDGRLIAEPNGDFTTICSGLSLSISGTSSAALTAMCTSGSLSLTSSIDLNTILTNSNGILIC